MANEKTKHTGPTPPRPPTDADTLPDDMDLDDRVESPEQVDRLIESEIAAVQRPPADS
ncbi:Hypothetical protein A7982_06640 [Minicystis rosea]|nr:Hypothetical protein A7982_06640 [Minicystis rosea]